LFDTDGEGAPTRSEEDQFDPEQSISAIIVHHPQAKHFSV
jgi:cobalamin-dependent methionine synthase I